MFGERSSWKTGIHYTHGVTNFKDHAEGLDDSIAGAFSQLAARRPGDTMVVSPTQRATFAEIDSLSRAVEQLIALARLEFGLIGLAAPNGPAFLAGFLAIQRTQHAALLLDPLSPQEDRRRVLNVMGANAILECGVAWPSSATDYRLSRVETPLTAPLARGIAAVKLTSGSTGVPRAVAMRAGSLMATRHSSRLPWGWQPDDRFFSDPHVAFLRFHHPRASAMVAG